MHINSYIAIQRTDSLKHFHWETIGVRQVLPIEPVITAEDLVGALRYARPGTFRNTARIYLPQPVKDAAAEQVLFQFPRVEIAKSGNSAHKYAPQQKMQGALRCGEHHCFSLSVYSPAAGLILRRGRPDACGAALERSTDGTALPQAGTGGAVRLREHFRSRFVCRILLKLFFCRGRL